MKDSLLDATRVPMGGRANRSDVAILAETFAVVGRDVHQLVVKFPSFLQ